MIILLFVYIIICYFLAFAYGFLMQELDWMILGIFFWPIIMVLYPIGGTVFMFFKFGKGVMNFLKKENNGLIEINHEGYEKIAQEEPNNV